MGKRTGSPSAKKAIFFSKNKEVANTYANIIQDPFENVLGLDLKSDDPFENIPKKGEVIEAFLDIKNPYIHDYARQEIREESFNNIIDKAILSGHKFSGTGIKVNCSTADISTPSVPAK